MHQSLENRKAPGSSGRALPSLMGWLPVTALVGASVVGRLSKSNGWNIKICPQKSVSLSVLKLFIPPFHILTIPGSCLVYTFLNPSTPQSRAEAQDTSLAGGPSAGVSQPPHRGVTCISRTVRKTQTPVPLQGSLCFSSLSPRPGAGCFPFPSLLPISLIFCFYLFSA